MENSKAIKYCKDRYRRTKGFELNLQNPRYFTEKIQWKKFYDHNPLYTITSDKLGIYDYLRSISSDVMPPKLLAVSSNGSIPNGLPEKWIAKATHGSGWNASYKEKNIVAKMKSWLSQKYVPEAAEWGYWDITPNVIFQEFLENTSEYKFFVFHGITKLVQHNTYGVNNTITNYDEHWNRLNVTYVYPQGKTTPQPRLFDIMKKNANWLGEPFDFVRVDFMVSSDALYLSEITHYPTSGFASIKPLEFDLYLGQQW